MPGVFHKGTSSTSQKAGERQTEKLEGAGSHSSSSASGSVPMNGGIAWHVSVTPSALVTISLLVAVLLGFSFLAGVATGLSHDPIPQAFRLESLIGDPPAKTDESVEESDQILPKEELRFLTNLKSEHATGILSEQGRKTVQPQAQEGRAVDPEPQKEAPAEPETPKDPQFDYVLRVAAFKAGDKAQELVLKLQKEGLKARRTQASTKRGTWYYAQTTFRGSEDDFAHHQALLASLGFRDTMLISKSPVSRKAEPPRKADSQEKKQPRQTAQKERGQRGSSQADSRQTGKDRKATQSGKSSSAGSKAKK